MKDHTYRPRRLPSILNPACAEREKKLLATTAAVAATIAAPTSADAQLIDEALS